MNGGEAMSEELKHYGVLGMRWGGSPKQRQYLDKSQQPHSPRFTATA